MASPQNYDQLLALAAKFLKRQDLTALMPTFVMFAEQYFNRKVMVSARRTSFSFTPSTNVFPLPSDCETPIQAYWGGRILDFFPRGFESGYAGGNSAVIANGWQIIGQNISLSVRDFDQLFRLDYYATLEGLSETNESNWMLEDCPDGYLGGLLHEAFSYVRDTQNATYWLQKRDAAISDYVDNDASNRRPDDQLTIRAG